MICAFIGNTEIIPFDAIECITFDEVQDTQIADILFSQSRETIRVSSEVKRLREEYIEYLKMISKAASLLDGIDE